MPYPEVQRLKRDWKYDLLIWIWMKSNVEISMCICSCVCVFATVWSSPLRRPSPLECVLTLQHQVDIPIFPPGPLSSPLSSASLIFSSLYPTFPSHNGSYQKDHCGNYNDLKPSNPKLTIFPCVMLNKHLTDSCAICQQSDSCLYIGLRCCYTVHLESIYSASLFHILLCYSLIPKLIIFIIFLEFLQTIPHNDNVQEVCLKSLQMY